MKCEQHSSIKKQIKRNVGLARVAPCSRLIHLFYQQIVVCTSVIFITSLQFFFFFFKKNEFTFSYQNICTSIYIHNEFTFFFFISKYISFGNLSSYTRVLNSSFEIVYFVFNFMKLKILSV